MKYRKLTSAGDYTLGTGADFYTNEPNAVGQAVKTRLALLAAEWFLDTADGTPWRAAVLGKYTKDTYDTVIRQRILSATGVVSITSYESDVNPNTRALTVRVTVATIYSTTLPLVIPMG